MMKLLMMIMLMFEIMNIKRRTSIKNKIIFIGITEVCFFFEFEILCIKKYGNGFPC